MKQRWVAAGMLEAQRSFRRTRGLQANPALVAALRRRVGGPGPGQEGNEAVAA